MRYLILLLSVLSVNAFAASADFTWQKPVPAFTAAVPSDWVIDEYRIYCVDDKANQFNATVPGYDTESYSMSGLNVGNLTCYMTSYSAAAGLESAPSASITRFIHEGGSPNAPSGFDFSAAF